MSLINNRGGDRMLQLLKDKEYQDFKEKVIKENEVYEKQINLLKAEMAKLQRPKNNSKPNQASTVQIALIFYYMEKGGYIKEIAKEPFSNLLAFISNKSNQNIRTWFTKVNTAKAKKRKNILSIRPFFEEMKLDKALYEIDKDLSEIK